MAETTQNRYVSIPPSCLEKQLQSLYWQGFLFPNCSNGVASNYGLAFSSRLVIGISFSYKKDCEPPYDKIEYTEEKGASGG
jgi:hypothetical protein